MNIFLQLTMRASLLLFCHLMLYSGATNADVANDTATASTRADACKFAISRARSQATVLLHDVSETRCDCEKINAEEWSCIGFVVHHQKDNPYDKIKNPYLDRK